MAVIWCNTCGGIIQSTESAGGKPCSCGRPPAEPSPECPMPHFSMDAVFSWKTRAEEAEAKLQAALLQIDEIRKSRDHWLEARQRAIEGGVILKNELEAANRLIARLQKGGDWMSQKLDKITRAAANGDAAAMAAALLEKPPQIDEVTWPEKPVGEALRSGYCREGNHVDCPVECKNGPCECPCHAIKRSQESPKECCCQAMGGGLMEHCPGCPKHNENPIHDDDHARKSK